MGSRKKKVDFDVAVDVAKTCLGAGIEGVAAVLGGDPNLTTGGIVDPKVAQDIVDMKAADAEVREKMGPDVVPPDLAMVTVGLLESKRQCEAAVQEPPKKTPDERLREEREALFDAIEKARAWKREQAYREASAKEEHKAAKESYSAACEAVDRLLDDLEKVRDRPVILAAELEPEVVIPPPSEWQSELLTTALGVDKSGLNNLDGSESPDAFNALLAVSEPLRNLSGVESGDLKTMGLVYRWMAEVGEGRISTLDLSAEDKLSFLDRLATWRSSKLWAANETYPDAFPLEFVTRKFHGLEGVKPAKKARKKGEAA